MTRPVKLVNYNVIVPLMTMSNTFSQIKLDGRRMFNNNNDVCSSGFVSPGIVATWHSWSLHFGLRYIPLPRHQRMDSLYAHSFDKHLNPVLYSEGARIYIYSYSLWVWCECVCSSQILHAFAVKYQCSV